MRIFDFANIITLMFAISALIIAVKAYNKARKADNKLKVLRNRRGYAKQGDFKFISCRKVGECDD